MFLKLKQGLEIVLFQGLMLLDKYQRLTRRSTITEFADLYTPFYKYQRLTRRSTITLPGLTVLTFDKYQRLTRRSTITGRHMYSLDL